MTNYIILALCILVIISYLFDISAKYSKIPGVILLIGLGIGMQVLFSSAGLIVPNIKSILPVIGTLGLILIVMEASLDLKLEKNKKILLKNSITSSLVIFVLIVGIMSYILVEFLGYTLAASLLNSIPFGIISSAVAISSSVNLRPEQREFVIYESSVSDIIGIMAFNLVLINQGSLSQGLLRYLMSIILTILIAIVTTSGLALLLHKINYHINYVLIMTSLILVYVLAELANLPALFLVLVFGLALSNNRLAEHSFIKKFVDFEKFRNDIESFKKIMHELTFLVRSFFFIMFGYYTSIHGLLNPANLLTGGIITAGILLVRWIFIRNILKISSPELILFAPRGLITILLFLNIPAVSIIPIINNEVVTLVILMTLIAMMIGNLLSKRETDKVKELIGEVTDS
jgi:Na+:H+ antiporter